MAKPPTFELIPLIMGYPRRRTALSPAAAAAALSFPAAPPSVPPPSDYKAVVATDCEWWRRRRPWTDGVGSARKAHRSQLAPYLLIVLQNSIENGLSDGTVVQ